MWSSGVPSSSGTGLSLWAVPRQHGQPPPSSPPCGTAHDARKGRNAWARWRRSACARPRLSREQPGWRLRPAGWWSRPWRSWCRGCCPLATATCPTTSTPPCRPGRRRSTWGASSEWWAEGWRRAGRAASGRRVSRCVCPRGPLFPGEPSAEAPFEEDGGPVLGSV